MCNELPVLSLFLLLLQCRSRPAWLSFIDIYVMHNSTVSMHYHFTEAWTSENFWHLKQLDMWAALLDYGVRLTALNKVKGVWLKQAGWVSPLGQWKDKL